MELKRLEKLAALEHRIDTARDKLAIQIKGGLMEVQQKIEEVKARIEEIKEENNV